MKRIIFVKALIFLVAALALKSPGCEESPVQKPIIPEFDYNWIEGGISPYRIAHIPTPEGYSRVKTKKGSFAEFLRFLPLKEKRGRVKLHNGMWKSNQDAHFRIIQIDTGGRDLQQCADAAMRLRAEFLYSQKRYEEIIFTFVNGFQADFSIWGRGRGISVRGNRVKWVDNPSNDLSYKSFRRFMVMVFSYANTASLAKQIKKIKTEDLQIGDLFIQPGFPGHAVIVVDKASKGKKIIFMLAQSYMPAQDMHVLKSTFNISPWYHLDFGESLLTPEWSFEKNTLYRF